MLNLRFSAQRFYSVVEIPDDAWMFDAYNTLLWYIICGRYAGPCWLDGTVRLHDHAMHREQAMRNSRVVSLMAHAHNHMPYEMILTAFDGGACVS